MNPRILLTLGLFGAAAACASLDSAAMSGSNMAEKNLGHSSTSTKSAALNEDKEAADANQAAEAGMKNAEAEMGGEAEEAAPEGEEGGDE